MGTICASNCTKIFMGKFGKTYIYPHIYSFSNFYCRFIDNIHTFYKQHFYKQLQAETGKKSANAKQNHEAKLWLFENYSQSSYTLSSKNNRIYSKK